MGVHCRTPVTRLRVFEGCTAEQDIWSLRPWETGTLGACTGQLATRDGKKCDGSRLILVIVCLKLYGTFWADLRAPVLLGC